MNHSATKTDPFPVEQISALRRGHAKLAAVKLDASTRALTRSNDRYARRMSVRFARWAALGCFQPVPGAEP